MLFLIGVILSLKFLCFGHEVTFVVKQNFDVFRFGMDRGHGSGWGCHLCSGRSRSVVRCGCCANIKCLWFESNMCIWRCMHARPAWSVVATAWKQVNEENSRFAQQNWRRETEFYLAGWHARPGLVQALFLIHRACTHPLDIARARTLSCVLRSGLGLGSVQGCLVWLILAILSNFRGLMLLAKKTNIVFSHKNSNFFNYMFLVI